MKNQNTKFYSYPRTQHIEGSNDQIGDDLEKVPFEQLKGKHLVVEEKVDGQQSAISFSSDGELLLQSRGHYLTGGYGERHFSLLKQMASAHRSILESILYDRYVMYGEWLYAKHTIFYNKLESYFMEFDVFDKDREVFLSTIERTNLLVELNDAGLSFPPVRVLYQGKVDSYDRLIHFVGDSGFVDHNIIHSDFEDTVAQSNNAKLDVELENTDLTGVMEGLYIKVEEDGIVKERYKFVRSSFTQKVIDSERHWQSRPIVRNIVDV